MPHSPFTQPAHHVHGQQGKRQLWLVHSFRGDGRFDSSNFELFLTTDHLHGRVRELPAPDVLRSAARHAPPRLRRHPQQGSVSTSFPIAMLIEGWVQLSHTHLSSCASIVHPRSSRRTTRPRSSCPRSSTPLPRPRYVLYVRMDVCMYGCMYGYLVCGWLQAPSQPTTPNPLLSPFDGRGTRRGPRRARTTSTRWTRWRSWCAPR